jgi:hypothetical protein
LGYRKGEGRKMVVKKILVLVSLIFFPVLSCVYFTSLSVNTGDMVENINAGDVGEKLVVVGNG